METTRYKKITKKNKKKKEKRKQIFIKVNKKTTTFVHCEL